MSKLTTKQKKKSFNLMSSTQLAEVLFHSTQVKEKIKRDCKTYGNILTEKKTNQIRIEVGMRICETIESLGGKALVHE